MKGLQLSRRLLAQDLASLRRLHCSSSALRAISTAALSEEQLDSQTDYWQKLNVCLVPLALGLGTASIILDGASCDANQGSNDVLIRTRTKVMGVWGDINEQIGRLEEKAPNPVHYIRPASPDVTQRGSQIHVKISLSPSVSTPGLLQQLVAEMQRGSNPQAHSFMMETTDYVDSQIITLQNAELQAQIYSPLSRQERAELVFLFDAKIGLSDQSLAIISSAMQYAARSQVDPSQPRRQLDPFLEGAGADIYRFFKAVVPPSVADSLEGQLDRLASEAFSEFQKQMSGSSEALEDFRRRMSWDTSHIERWLDKLQKDRTGSWPQPPSHELDTTSRELFIPGASSESPGIQHQHDLQSAKMQREAAAGKEASDYGSSEANRAVKKLEQLGAIVYPPGNKEEVDWGLLAGYEEQKEIIEETLLLALTHPEVYSEISSKTRKQKGENRPRAVLFEGPPGCGKTTSARVLASQASAPLVYVPVEAIFSKWYGESEKKLSEIFKHAEKLDSCLIFLDEIDSLATSRGSDMHEATRRILGVLLRHMDGFEGKKTVIIGATNRKQDLDAALRSRFDASIFFQLPNKGCRQQILAQYAQQLSEADLEQLANVCQGMSGRDLRDICESAERRVAAKIVKGVMKDGSLPGVQDYMRAAEAREKQGKVNSPASLPVQPLNPWL